MRSRSGLVVGIGIAAVLFIVVVYAGQGGGGGGSLDPDSTAEDGTRALVELLDRFAGSVTVENESVSDQTTTALVLRPNRLESVAEQDLEAWVRRGGTAVQLGTGLGFGPDGGPASFDRTRSPERCTEPALGVVGDIVTSGGSTVEIEPGDRSCHGDGRQAYVVVRDVGSGTLVTLGGSAVFTNRNLDDEDNSVLAVTLLAPTETSRVAIIRSQTELIGTASSFDLLGPRFDRAVWQGLIAFGVLALAVGIRLGRPVSEPLPVRIESSSFIAAVGGLLRDSRRPDLAGARLRRRARFDLGRQLGLGPSATDEQIAESLAGRAGLPADDTLAVLAGPTIASDDDLVRLARGLDGLRAAASTPGGVT